MPHGLPGDERVLRGIADQETARLRDGTLPWSWWLERAVLHGRRYGYLGILLISAQWRGATDVRSYEEWRSAGRQVRKGETGIRVLGRAGAPRAVFDVSQTDGLPLPASLPTPLPASLPTPLPASLPTPLPAPFTTPSRPEAAHRFAALTGNAGGGGVRRVEADSVTFLVAAWLGLAPSMPDFPARAFWAGPGMGDRILRTARRRYEEASGASEHGIMPDAHRFFRARLAESWVPRYLAGRGFPAGVQRRWRIGYAPDGARALTGHLRTLGHGDDEIVASGLARRGHAGRLHDTFRDRAMFAIRTADGAVAGFIGRRRDGARGPKYLNGPDTFLFHKGELLYGLHEARDRLAASARPVIVEGPLDAIAVTIAGPAEYAAVATCGLALTSPQVDALGNVADLDGAGVLVALDGDPAGRSGAVRAWDRLAGIGGPIDTAALPAGRDPAGLLKADGRAAVLRALRARTPLMDAVVDTALERAGGPFGGPEEQLAAIRAASKIIATRPPDAAHQVVRVAARMNVPTALVTEILIDTVSP
ncbi:toprim domain-containing protein [Actinomadura sp. 3N407]|uniref:toprim domain-containing protein n=1 Tax=Actinomadura sp. 3N407 TaxID=3457423 RepID=UPI003FCDAD41